MENLTQCSQDHICCDVETFQQENICDGFGEQPLKIKEEFNIDSPSQGLIFMQNSKIVSQFISRQCSFNVQQQLNFNVTESKPISQQKSYNKKPTSGYLLMKKKKSQGKARSSIQQILKFTEDSSGVEKGERVKKQRKSYNVKSLKISQMFVQPEITHKWKTKTHLIGESTKDQLKNILNNIEANTYRQIQEKKKTYDGKQEKSFKVFKTCKKIDIEEQKQNKEFYSKPVTRRSNYASQNNTEIEQQTNDCESGSQLIHKIKSKSHKSKFTPVFQPDGHSYMVKNYPLRSKGHPRRSLRFTKIMTIKPQNQAANSRSPSYKWSKWRINPIHSQLQQYFEKSENNIISDVKQNKNERQIYKKYQALYKLVNMSASLQKLEQNNRIIGEFKQKNKRRIDNFFTTYETEISISKAVG